MPFNGYNALSSSLVVCSCPAALMKLIPSRLANKKHPLFFFSLQLFDFSFCLCCPPSLQYLLPAFSIIFLQHTSTYVINSLSFAAVPRLAVMAVVMLVANMQGTEGNICNFS